MAEVLVSSDLIKELRESTGAGLLDCKKALVENGADMQKAIDYLREKGMAKAAKRVDKETKEGRVISFIHESGTIGALLELNCETDFVAKNEDFEKLGKEIAIQMAAANPSYLEVSGELNAAGKEFKSKTPAKDKTTHIQEFIAKFGENITIGKSDRFQTTGSGRVISYIHSNGKIGVLLELNCKSDSVAANPEFEELGKEISLQVAAVNPLYLNVSDVPKDVIEKETQILKSQLLEQGKKPEQIDKIIPGKLTSFYSEVCLLEQQNIKDNKKTMKEIIQDASKKFGEEISIGRYIRYQIGG